QRLRLETHRLVIPAVRKNPNGTARAEACNQNRCPRRRRDRINKRRLAARPNDANQHGEIVNSRSDNSQQIFTEYSPRIFFAQANLIERGGLFIENLMMPASGEEGGIRAEQQPLRPNHVQSAAKDVPEIQMRLLITHPRI